MEKRNRSHIEIILTDNHKWSIGEIFCLSRILPIFPDRRDESS